MYHEFYDLTELGLIERAEEDNFVETVEELGAEGAGIDEAVGEVGFEVFQGLAGLNAGPDVVGAGVTGGNDDGVLERGGVAGGVG